VAEGDSLVTASAGVPFSALQEAVAAKRQRLDIDPPFADRATVGGVVAANAYGLLRCSAGPVADLIVAARIVTGAGEVVKTGAHVVKNAAGYSLSRLIAGSHGSLGIIAEVTFRTNPQPPARLAGIAHARDLNLATSAALSLQDDLPSLDYVAVIGDNTSDPAVIFGTSGTDGFVHSASEAASRVLAQFGLQVEPDEALCDSLAEQARRTLHGCRTDAALRLSVPPSRGAEAAAALARASDRWVWLVPSGIVAAGIVGDEHRHQTHLAGAAVRAVEQGGYGLWLRQPPGARFRRVIGPSSPIEDRLVRSAKAAFDPAGILSPGRVEGD
jgi:FAD/FMN-containing dehydrogenase